MIAITCARCWVETIRESGSAMQWKTRGENRPEWKNRTLDDWFSATDWLSVRKALKIMAALVPMSRSFLEADQQAHFASAYRSIARRRHGTTRMIALRG
jgi:hypothetical protein